MSNNKYTVPRGYLDSFTLAISTFLFQIVYDPVNEIWVNLTNPEENKEYGPAFLAMENKDFLGKIIPKELAKDFCTCKLDMRTWQPFNMEALLQEYWELNNPVLLISSSSEDEEEKSNGLKEISDHSNLEVPKKKKPASMQKKFTFSMGKKSVAGKKRRRIPSPYKNKLVEDVVNLERLNKMRANKNIKKKKLRQLILTDKDLATQKEKDSDEEEAPSNSLISIFKRAKRSEQDTESKDVIIPKLQTIKKKTFMRSLASRNIKF